MTPDLLMLETGSMRPDFFIFDDYRTGERKDHYLPADALSRENLAFLKYLEANQPGPERKTKRAKRHTVRV